MLEYLVFGISFFYIYISIYYTFRIPTVNSLLKQTPPSCFSEVKGVEIIGVSCQLCRQRSRQLGSARIGSALSVNI